MFRVRRRAATRLSAALVATGFLAAGAIATAAPAAADEQNPSQNPGGATGTLANEGKLTEDAGPALINVKGEEKQVAAGLFQLDVDGGGSLKTYCIDIFNPTKADARYQETSWEQSSLQGNKDAGRILWILKNSYPQVNDLEKLANDAGVDSLDAKQAAAGTQVAIWRLSDHVNVKALDKSAQKLTDHLLKNAKSMEEPEASLKLDPTAVSGKAGEKLGPIKVSTSASNATVALDHASAAKNVKVVDADGKAVTSAVNDDELYVDVPADAAAGTASLSVKVSTELSVGRAFTSMNGVKSQTQILAGTSASTVEATATAAWESADHKGPLPAVTAEKNCAEGGLDITVDNKGDEEFVFTLEDKEYKIAAGKSETVFWPVAEDSAYQVEISMPDGTKKVFEGVLDCKTDSTTGSTTGGSEPSSEPSPASAGGSSAGTTGGGDLAETGSSNATPVIAGVAVGLVVVGGAAVFLLRKRKSTPSGE